MPALYGAAGVIHNPELTRVLLEAGANADDGESPYHSTEAPDPECLRLRARVRRQPGADRPRARARLRPPGARQGPARRRRGRERAAARSPSAAAAGRRSCGCSSSTARSSRRAAARTGASRSGGARRTSTPCCAAATTPRSTLAELGADTHVDADDLAVAAIARGERPETVPTDLDYDQQEVLILYALRDGMAHVVDLLRAGLPRRRRRLAGGLAARSTSAGSGHAEHARFLVGAGAAIGDAFEWCVHGSQNHAIAGRDYVGVAEALGAGHRGAPPGAGGRSAGRVARSTAPTVSPNAT